ncbi:patatin-like phospholipase family protein [Novosphingopyxis sp.]|uniref:patatin-like phospholipase family protein n=1 Tax=Novosphingopyxis sp. TaxID=2709690 RepID=UPI003B598FA7
MMSRLRTIVLILALSLTAGGCTHWPDRPDISVSFQERAQVPGYVDIRHWSDASEAEWLAWRGKLVSDRTAAGVRGPPSLLAISSGSDKGAFAAGYLHGWTLSGDRPNFSVVTGVSTGALIAPFAFLGSVEDATLRRLYTGIDASDIFKQHALAGITGGPSFASTKPLEALIARYVDEALVDRIAQQHLAGRRLLVMTTNLDAQRGMVWDMGAIATSENPNRIALFRKILLASSSIPGIFPPVLIKVSSGSATFEEMHVDGGTTSSVFALPPNIIFEDSPDLFEKGGQIVLIYNGQLAPDFDVVKPTAFSIIARALTTVIGEADRASIRSLRRFTDEHGIALDIEAIGADFSATSDKLFDQEQMQKLYTYGCHRSLETKPTALKTNGSRCGPPYRLQNIPGDHVMPNTTEHPG